ncbi:MAG: YbaN family protein [Cognatishimia sp.]|nr:YbaN family protein [Cognatishimia sp.]
MRYIWTSAGLICVGLALLGIPLPLLPTVPFLLLAAFCFARGSKRLHDWLTTHPRLGPPIEDWNQRGAILIKAKLLATISVALVFGISLVFGVPIYVLAVQAVALGLVMVFIWTRPSQ